MKIKAFTITELVIALAISALVASLGYYAIATVGNTVRLKNENLAVIEQLQELRFILKYDFNQYHDWELIANRLQSEEGGIFYRFEKEYIERNQQNKTQHFGYDLIKCSWNRNEITGNLEILDLEINRKQNNYRMQFRIMNDVQLFSNEEQY